MRASQRFVAAISIAGALLLGSVAPASAAIHEIVASFCSGGQGNLEPPGQVRFGEQSFLRALQATGMYTIRVGVVPEGQAGPDAGTTPVTVDIDYSRPMSKFSAAGFYVRFVEEPFTVYLWAPVPDHPAFDHCPNAVFGL